MTEEPKWLTTAAVIAVHEMLLAEHGGPDGVRDQGALEAALGSPKNHFAYGERSLFMLAGAYAFSLTKNHPFGDGNKRVALTSAGVFLELNGITLTASEHDAVAATIALSAGTMSSVQFATWLETSSETRG